MQTHRCPTLERNGRVGDSRIKDHSLPSRFSNTVSHEHMEWMASAFKNGCYLHCPNGGHMAMYDAQRVYMSGLTRFIIDVETGRIP